MTTTTSNTPRDYAECSPTDFYDFPVLANVHLFVGEALTQDPTTGYAHTLTTTESFLGFLEHEVNNLTTAAAVGSGAAFSGATIGDGTGASCTANVRKRGQVVLSVADGGTLAGTAADRGSTVYATDGNTFTGSSSGSAVSIGKIVDWLGGTNYLVEFEAVISRSI